MEILDHIYIIPQHPTLCVKLLHVVVDDKGICFLEIRDDQKLPEIPERFMLRMVSTGYHSNIISVATCTIMYT